MSSNSCSFPFGRSRFGKRESNVPCPVCNKGKLTTMFSCFDADFICPSCGKKQPLTDLVKVLNDEDFTTLAEMVEDRFSNRV